MIRVGISGWNYAPWRGDVFYPSGLVQRRELEYASRQVTTIEINSTFYRLQKPASFQKWYDQTPSGFEFAVKATQFITHIRRCKDVEQYLNNFLATGLLALREKLGVIFWQIPPSLVFSDDRFEDFFALLPRTLAEAGQSAERHDDFLKGDAYTAVAIDKTLRHAIEVRHSSFLCPEFVDLARRYRVAIVIADAGEHVPRHDDITSDFLYLRCHGQTISDKNYTGEQLDRIAEEVMAWARGEQIPEARCVSPSFTLPTSRDIYVYFDNDDKGAAPRNARELMARLKIGPLEDFVV